MILCFSSLLEIDKKIKENQCPRRNFKLKEDEEEEELKEEEKEE